MQGEMGWFAHLGFQIMKLVRHLLVSKHESHDVHERAARKAVYNEFGHTALLRRTCFSVLKVAALIGRVPLAPCEDAHACLPPFLRLPRVEAPARPPPSP